MANTSARSSLTRILRAATSHHNAIILHTHPPFELPRFKSHFRTSTFQRVHTSNPSDLQILKPKFIFTFTSRSVHTRATTLQNPRNPRSIWPYATAFGCIATGLIIIYKFQETPYEGLKGTVTASDSEEPEVRIQAAFPGLFRKDHSVVLVGVCRPVTDECWEYYSSVTEVLAKSKQVKAAMEMNHNIMARKLIALDEERREVANEKVGVAERAERQAMLDGYRNSSKLIIKSASDPLETKFEGNVYEFALNPKTEDKLTRLLKHILVRFQGLSDLLQEGNSVFIKVFETLITDENREDKSDAILEDELADINEEILEDELADINEDKSTKSFTIKDEDVEYHISVEVLTKSELDD